MTRTASCTGEPGRSRASRSSRRWPIRSTRPTFRGSTTYQTVERRHLGAVRSDLRRALRARLDQGHRRSDAERPDRHYERAFGERHLGYADQARLGSPGKAGDRGPSWVGAIVNAIGESQYWNYTAIVVVWDDWGGWYDNAPPPQLDFRGLGIRIPCLIVSPYAKQGYVSHTQYEFGSILKFIEQVYSLPPLGATSDGYADVRANSIIDSFDFHSPPRAFTHIPTKYHIKDFLNEPKSWSDEPIDDE